MGLRQYKEPSWLQDLLTPAFGILVFAISPVVWAVVIVICLVWLLLDLRSKKPTPLDIIRSCAQVCTFTILVPFITTADALRRFGYRSSRLASELRRYVSKEPLLRRRHRNKKAKSSSRRDSDVSIHYDYPELKGEHEIRLFEIYPEGETGTFRSYHREGVRGRLIHSNLLWSPKYDAVSYTWADEEGDAAETEEVYLMNEHATVAVSKNCVKVLEKLRLSKQRRLVWIDAICIDQHSDPDRTHQVSLMSKIYMSANKVIAYTGEATKQSDLLFDFMNSVQPEDLVIPTNLAWPGMLDSEGQAWVPGTGQLIAGLEYSGHRLTALRYKLSSWFSGLWSTILCRGAEEAQPDPALSLDDVQVLDAAAEFFSRRWFQRVWTLQEVALPDVGSVEIMCGDKSTSAARALHSLSLLPTEKLGGALTLGRFFLMLRNKVMSPEKSHLLDVLIETRDRQCSDPRDKIFGVLSIASGLDEGRHPDFAADYDLTTAQVYAKYSRFFIEDHGLAFFWALIKSPPVVPDLPSWSADWSVAWPNDKAIHGRHLPATSRKVDGPDPNVSFETDSDGSLLLKIIRPAVTGGVFTRDGHLDGSTSTTVEEVGDLEEGHHLVKLCPGVCALLREVGAHYEFIQVCPHHSEVDGLHQVIDAWTEYVVDGKISDTGNVDENGDDYLSSLKTYLVR